MVFMITLTEFICPTDKFIKHNCIACACYSAKRWRCMDEQEGEVAALKGFSCTRPLFVAFIVSISPFENHTLISFWGTLLPIFYPQGFGKGTDSTLAPWLGSWARLQQPRVYVQFFQATVIGLRREHDPSQSQREWVLELLLELLGLRSSSFAGVAKS